MGFYWVLWVSPARLHYPSSLGFIGLPLTPYFHYFGPAVAHSHFFTSYTAHGLLISLFPDSFKPIYPLKAHLFILWVCDPLFLPLGLNGFSIHLLILFCLRCWASPFHLDFQNGHQHCLWAKKNSGYRESIGEWTVAYFVSLLSRVESILYLALLLEILLLHVSVFVCVCVFFF